MAYSDFKANDLRERFGIQFRAADLFTPVAPLAPSDWLTEALDRGQELGFASEKSRSERLVTPLLLELSKLNQHCFSVYSGVNIDVDEARGLKGECNFVFSLSRVQDFLNAPVFCITEAKKQDLEQGTVQAAAQLIGARLFNEREQTPVRVLYGASTTGLEWRFLRYENTDITIDEKRYSLYRLPELPGVLQTIVEQATQGLPPTQTGWSPNQQ